MMADILIFSGPNGFFAQAAKRYFDDRVVLHTDRVTKMGDILAAIKSGGQKIIINAIAKTKTDLLEQDEKAATEAVVANVVVPMYFARALEELGDDSVRLFHISTGMVYDCSKGIPLPEGDQATPRSVYARQKLLADQVLTEQPSIYSRQNQVTILRIHLPFSAMSHEKNFIDKMWKVPKFFNEPNSMTCLEDLFTLIDPLATKAGHEVSLASGIIHVTNPGLISAYDIAEQMQRYSLLDNVQTIEPMSRQELDAYVASKNGAYQPRVVLQSYKLRGLNLEMSPVRDALKRTLRLRAPTQIAAV